MRALFFPTAGGGTVALASLAFYALFARFYGSGELARIVYLQAAMAMIQMALVPQAWLFVMAGRDRPEIARRHDLAMWIELLSGGVALAVVLAATAALPPHLIGGTPPAALAMFGGLWIAGSTSHQGALRAGEHWVRLFGWVTLPALLRLVLVIAVPRLAGRALTGLQIIVVFFLLPDLARFAMFHLGAMLRRLRPHSVAETVATLRGIGHNWLYDIGSAITENIDKIVVGLVLDPMMLVVYFFGRRFGGAFPIVTEPAFAEIHRRRQRDLPVPRAILVVAGGGVLVVLLVALIAVLAREGATASYFPPPVRAHIIALLMLVAIDGGVSLNRWGRYLAQQGRASSLLLTIRLAARALFAVLLFVLHDIAPAERLVAAYGVMWLAETLMLGLMLDRRRRSVPAAADMMRPA